VGIEKSSTSFYFFYCEASIGKGRGAPILWLKTTISTLPRLSKQKRIFGLNAVR